MTTFCSTVTILLHHNPCSPRPTLMRRHVVPERLDSDAGTPHEVLTSLDDLQRINTLFGGVTSTAKLARRVATETGTNTLSLLEVASGNGFVPKTANDWLASD